MDKAQAAYLLYIPGGPWLHSEILTMVPVPAITTAQHRAASRAIHVLPLPHENRLKHF